MSQYNVRSSQTVAAAFFCLDAAARACLDPFVPIYLRHHALNAFHAGAVIGVATILAAALVPSLVWLPRWRRQGWRSILLASSALAAICYIALLTVPPVSNQYQLTSPCAQVHLKVPATMTTAGLSPSSSSKVHPTSHRGTSAKPTYGVGTSAKPSSPRLASAGTYEPMPTALPRVSATSAVTLVLRSTVQQTSTREDRGHSDPAQNRTRLRRQVDGGSETTHTAGKQNMVPVRPDALPGKDSTTAPESHGAGRRPTGVPGQRRKKVLRPEYAPVTVTPAQQNVTSGHRLEGDQTPGRNCDGAMPDPDCFAPSEVKKEEEFDHSILLLVTLIVVFGESMLSLAGLAADESFFRFLDEIDATEKTNAHRTHSAIISAVILGISAVLATQVPCLPLSTWGSSTEVYLLVFGALVSMSLPLAAFFPEPQQAVRRRSSTGTCRGVADALRSGEGALVAGTLVLLGALAGVEGTFFLWHLEEGGHSNALGAVVMARAVARVAALLLVKAGGLPGRLHGWLIFAVLCTSARCACYVQSGWQLAAMAQLLSPPSTVLLWFACERWARRTTTGIDAERCLLAALSVCHRGIGTGVGAVLGGVGAFWVGTRSALGLCAVVGIIGGAVVFAATRFVAPRPPSYDRLLWDPTSPNSESESEEEARPLDRRGCAVPDASS
ncbi:unnamed protein product [Ixodes hexagonus]